MEVYHYPGGEAGSPNVQRLFPFLFETKNMVRGEALWMRNRDVFNQFFGAFDLVLNNRVGVEFRDSMGQISFRLRNRMPTTTTVSMSFLTSEAAPLGQPPIVAPPPLLVKGNLNITNLSYGYTGLGVGSSTNWILKPAGDTGSELEVVLGVNRATMTGPEGSLYAGILRFTDWSGLSQIDVPVSAKVPSSAGLWVGAANVGQVGHYLQNYAKATNDTHLALILSKLNLTDGNGTNYIRDAQTGLIIVKTAVSGAYLSTNVVSDSGSVSQPVSLRLIIHNPAGGSHAKLLQRVYYGLDVHTNAVVATSEKVLNPVTLSQARRISAPHLPWSASNMPWSFNGRLKSGSGITVQVVTGFDDHSSNPFLHSYHPDHDNLDASFKDKVPQGQESYELHRTITLNPALPPDDFASLTSSGSTISGTYVETITLVGLAKAGGGNEQRQFISSGAFALNRISDIPILSTP